MTKRGRKSVDQDVKVLKRCAAALTRSSSRRMLVANLEFLFDYFIRHPSPELPKHLREPETSR